MDDIYTSAYDMVKNPIYTRGGESDWHSSHLEKYSKHQENKTDESGVTDGRQATATICSKAHLAYIIFLSIIAIILTLVLASLVFLIMEVFRLKSEAVTSSSEIQQSSSIINQLNHSLTGLDSEQGSIVRNLHHSIVENVSTIAELIEQLNYSIIGLNAEQEQIMRNIIGQYSTFPASSCANLPTTSPSGYYWLRNFTGPAVYVYCNMKLCCGNITGGWRRVVELDMTTRNRQCPRGLNKRFDGSRRTCVRNESSDGCSRVDYPVELSGYSNICGRVTGYRIGNPDAFHNSDISGNYLDGISLTYRSLTQHIWSFAVSGDSFSCPGSVSALSSVIEGSYFCETGNRPLWNW